MAGRIRSLKPEWLDDEKLASMSDEARLLSASLLLLADDYGNGRANPLHLASCVWKYGDPVAGLAKVARGLRELCANTDGTDEPDSFVVLYTVKKQQYFSIRNWKRHQRVDHPGKPVVPAPSDADMLRWEHESPSDPYALASRSREPREPFAPDLGIELKGGEGPGATTDERDARKSDPPPRPPRSSEPEAWVVVHRVASDIATWMGDLSSEHIKASCVRVVAKAKETAQATQADDWETALRIVFARWVRNAKPGTNRLRLPNWPQKLLEDWHDTVESLDEDPS